MSKELKVKYENFKSKYKVIPEELIVESEKTKYNRAKKKEQTRKLAKDYLGEDRV